MPMTRPAPVAKVFACLALAALLAGAVPAAARAASSQGTAEQRRACRADAMRLCREFIPNVKRITACMERNVDKLSPPCRAQFR
ncbi:hypothetical protein DW352_24075 [Pseudolabrys taiwanensis]|uniref:Cysteine rich repeat protein n=1 Tax=Pseudolabrys taiwanensis TaxID=331696 RepID=A0A346A2D1_9HYPH|nr:hypothetical protein [Pseudolabrys taiwanensis]AXK83328.1 hypothetical protein DW352_24075 [Pseudolabrys taiwanensis]